MKPRLIASASTTVLMLLCTVASGQQPAGAKDPLSAACDGAWTEVRQSIDQLRTINLTSTREGREKLSCLLDAVSRTTFSSRDADLDILLAHQAVKLLIDAVGPDGYDFFAAQIQAYPSRRVQPALVNSLLSHGQPEAFETYFSELRRDSADKDAPKRDSQAALALFEPLVLHGRCSAELCSARLNETLRIVGSNLGLVEVQLRRLESDAASTSNSLERSRRLRGAIQRIVLNEARMGNAPE